MTTKAYKRRQEAKSMRYSHMRRNGERRCDWPACLYPSTPGHKFCEDHLTVEKFEARALDAIGFTSQMVSEWDDERWFKFAGNVYGHGYDRLPTVEQERYVLAAKWVAKDRIAREKENTP